MGGWAEDEVVNVAHVAATINSRIEDDLVIQGCWLA
jgi:hypothetical protein